MNFWVGDVLMSLQSAKKQARSGIDIALRIMAAWRPDGIGCRWRTDANELYQPPLVVDVPHASVQPRHRWARPGHLHRMVADWDCIVRKLVRVADGRVDPRVKIEDGHDVGGESRFQRRLV